VKAAEELHGGDVSEYIQSIVFGGLDGIITTFAVLVAAVSGRNLSYGTILIITFANLLGDAIGMGVGDFISSKAEDDAATAERKREQWEIENIPEDEKREMMEIYTSKGYTQPQAKELVDILFPHKEAFLDTMMIQELGIMPDGDGPSAWKSALITFTSFIVLGGIPALSYLFSGSYNKVAAFDGVFAASVVLFAVTLFTLGAFRGRITGKRWYLTGLTMLLNGGFTSVIAFIFGFFIR
jgi:VIT1/CCC1 family predicted Fe2+/Mn2+ transporter